MMNNMIGPIGMLLAGMVIADVPLKTVFTKKGTMFRQYCDWLFIQYLY
ncbi:MAG: hypothetical protein ACLT8I_09160 [Blautia faecis]